MDIAHLVSPIKVDPDINKIAVTIMLILLVALFILVAMHITSLKNNEKANQEAEKLKAEKDFWFDTHKSILHRGSQQLVIPESSLEYYVCKLVFINPKEYRADDDVLQAAGEWENTNPRAVYFAVDRINNKARREWKLEDNLLKRNKERTRLNDNYF